MLIDNKNLKVIINNSALNDTVLSSFFCCWHFTPIFSCIYYSLLCLAFLVLKNKRRLCHMLKRFHFISFQQQQNKCFHLLLLCFKVPPYYSPKRMPPFDLSIFSFLDTKVQIIQLIYLNGLIFEIYIANSKTVYINISSGIRFEL